MVQNSAHHHAATSSNPTSMGYNANLKTFAEVLQSHVCHFSHFSTQDPRMALLSGNHRKNRCFWRRSPIFLNLGWYILGSKWIAFPYHDRYIYHKHIYIYMDGMGFVPQKVMFCASFLVICLQELKGAWRCGILGGRAPQAMCRVAIFCISKFWPSKTRKLQSCLGSPWHAFGHRLFSPSNTQEREVFCLLPHVLSRTHEQILCFFFLVRPDVLRVFFGNCIPLRTNKISWKIPTIQ